MRTLRNNKGFTLIELMIVVVIIGILAAIAIPKFSSLGDDAKMKEAEAALKQVATLEQAFRAKCGSFMIGVGAALVEDPAAPDADPCSTLTDVGFEQPTLQYYNFATLTVAAGAAAGTFTVAVDPVAGQASLTTATYDSATGRITH